MILTNSVGAIQGSFYDLWYTVAMYVPRILAAVIVFIIGWIVATILFRLVREVVRVLKIDEALRTAGVHDAAKEADIHLDVGRFLATLVMWFVVIVFLVAALEILGLTTVTAFLGRVVLLYIPQVMVASLILIVGAIAANIAKGIVVGAAHATSTHAAHFAGTVAKWAIWIFAILAALDQLGDASMFVQTLFTGVVVALALAFGLAFGLGGKDAAANLLDKVRKEIRHEM